ncbi:hypothetical protein [Streptomyces sp. NPDC001194]|uniref:hypothetical protein n=1 Tax=Streptomyces sp. NPDC001194 TaxID=3364547 RepID=UPI00367571F6
MTTALDDRERADNPDHDEAPWTRPLALGRAADAEWFAAIYSDITLDPARRHLDRTALAGTRRIIVGAPVRVRAAGPDALVRHAERRRSAPGLRPRWRRLPAG